MLLLRSSVAAALLAASAAAANAPVCVPTGFSDVCRGSGVRIVVGPYNLTTCNATAWTFRDLWYEGFELLSPTGFTQTVSNVDIAPNTHSTVWPALQPVSPACPVIRQGPNGPPAPGAPAGSGFLGTGHGGEFVFSVTLEVNRSNNGTAGFRSKASAIRKDAATGSEETLAETAARLPTRLHSFQIDAFNILRDGLGGLPPLPVNGSAWPEAVSLAVVKQSQIGPFLATQRVTLFPDRGMQVDANFTLAYANNASAVNWFYSCMTMFALPLTEWVAAFANGTVSEPVKFLADDSFSLQADIRWAAVFDTSASFGAVYQYPTVYNGSAGFHNSFWNRAYDHKLYLRVNVPTTVGASFGFSHQVQGFVADPDNWVATAANLVRAW